MIDVRNVEVRSIEELIQALHPIQATSFRSGMFEATTAELRLMKNNISSVLSFTTYSLHACKQQDDEFQRGVEDVRRECLLMNGMISRILFRKRWLFMASKNEDRCAILLHYENMARAACRLCLLLSPELGSNLLNAF